MGENYWTSIWKSVSSILTGLRLTFRHIVTANKTLSRDGVDSDNYFSRQEGLMTLQYPHESLPVPDNGRYRLHNEIEDCIVCDKCAKVCPVDCIEIDAIKADEVFGTTSDGTPKRIYAARFDIDMGKCCFCGLCTTVCPTECLTMTKAYDFSEFDVIDHIYSFGNMSDEEIREKRIAAGIPPKPDEPDKRPSSKMDKPTLMPADKPRPQMPMPRIKPGKKDD